MKMNERTIFPSIKREKEQQCELWQWTASEMVSAIKSRKVSSWDIVQSSLDRIEEMNPKLNALGEVFAEEALLAAEWADQAVAAGEELGPLHGVPMSIKINSDQKGKATTNGVVAFQDNI